ncbi:aldo/keto reductase [Agromyces silvae]|uniref:aldo/keto reductase n=1 Tax=Agromyces silvae TaxID=3388266 RepID=UPI00280C298B|nr:aldo/keto reductase [Agromyces protaetiae]
MSDHGAFRPARLGLGLAAIGRPAYITSGRARDLGAPDTRTVHELRDRAHELIDVAWDLGVRYLDAARSYGHAEEFIGSWLARHPGRRDELVIGSKWGYAYVGGWRMDASVHERKDHGLDSFETQWPETIQALRTRPDLYLVHSVTPDSPALGDAALLDALRRLAERGVRVGLSTSGPRQADVIRQAARLPDSPFSAVQTTWNLLEPSAAPALAEVHDAGWVVVVKEALANGRLAGDDEPRLTALAAAAGHALDELAIGAALAQPWASIVLSGAVTADQLRRNADARPTPIDAATSSAFAEPPDRYWADRQRRAWT